MSRKYLLALILCLTAVCAAASAQAPPQAPAPQPSPAKSVKETAPTQGQQHPEVGERVFEQNCSRCHTTPDGFSSHISGTVVMHMRVRASLSQADAQALLRFLNP